jgi:predicted Zn-dependent protease
MKSVLCILVLGILISVCSAQQNSSSAGESQNGSPDAEAELQTGIRLTSSGHFAEAIPHLLAARGRVSEEYAASFDLALCYVGTSRFKDAIRILAGLTGESHDADVYNLLAQSEVGDHQPREALADLEKAAALTPTNEKLYLLVADACTGNQSYELGLSIVDLGLKNLPESPRLHYQRGLFLASLDEFDKAKPDFDAAIKLAAGSGIGYLAGAHEALLAGNISDAVRIARAGLKSGDTNPVLHTILGEALIRSGVSPGQPEFAEAQTILESSVAKRPSDVPAQIALGELYLMSGRLDEAITHLEQARQLDAAKPSVYANLAKAYQRRGDTQKAQDALAFLAKLNQAQAEKIRLAPGDRKAGYGEAAGVAAPEKTPK